MDLAGVLKQELRKIGDPAVQGFLLESLQRLDASMGINVTNLSAAVAFTKMSVMAGILLVDQYRLDRPTKDVVIAAMIFRNLLRHAFQSESAAIERTFLQNAIMERSRAFSGSELLAVLLDEQLLGNKEDELVSLIRHANAIALSRTGFFGKSSQLISSLAA